MPTTFITIFFFGNLKYRALAKALSIQESQVFVEEYSDTLIKEGKLNLNLVISIEKSLASIVNRAIEVIS